MKNIILFAIMIFVVTTAYGQERNILWAHGLNSNGDFWNDEYARAQRDYRIRSTGFSFPTNEGVIPYTNRIMNASQGIRGAQSIGIGHSLGGVAMREIDRQDPNMFGGYITFGAPLDGARIANGVIQGTPINQFIIQSVDNLRRGPIESSTRSKWDQFRDSVTDVFNGGKGIASMLIRSFASRPILDITNDLTEGFQQSISDIYNPNDPSVRDLAENSNYMNSVRSYNSILPKLKVYGEINSPSHLRLFLSTITFDTNFTNLLMGSYNGVASAYKLAGDGISIGFWPLCGSSCRDRQRRQREAWYIGNDYLVRGWEVSWNRLIGASVLESYTVTEPVYVCDGLHPLALEPYTGSDCYDLYCDDCRWEYRNVTYQRWVNQSSDGLIKKSSQVGELSNWGGNEVRLSGVNHLEMGIHPNTNPLLVRVFNGNNGPFFQTARR